MDSRTGEADGDAVGDVCTVGEGDAGLRFDLFGMRCRTKALDTRKDSLFVLD